MINTLKIFSQKIAYGFGFGSGMCIAYTNVDLIKFDIKLKPISPHIPFDKKKD